MQYRFAIRAKVIRKMQNSHTLALTRLRAGDLAYRRGDFHSAISNYDGAIRGAETSGEPNIKSIALVKKSICLSARNRLNEAESLLRQAMSFEAENFLDAGEAALLHHEYSILLFRLKRMSEGLQQEQIALRLLTKAEPLDSQLLILILKQLAVYMTLDKEFELANDYLEDAIRVALSTPEIGKDSLLHGQLLVTQALSLVDQKKFDEARELFDRAILLIQIHEGQHNPKVAELFRLISKHFKDAGQIDEAEVFKERAQEVERLNAHNGKIW